MPRFVLEKLPAHWIFLPSKRQVRELLAELGSDVRLVEFAGTAHGQSSDRVSIGFIESRVFERCWCFYLRLWGVRDAVAGRVREELAATALAEIRQYLGNRAGMPPADTVKPAQLLLSFRLEGAVVRSQCTLKRVSRHSFPTGPWWVTPQAAEPTK